MTPTEWRDICTQRSDTIDTPVTWTPFHQRLALYGLGITDEAGEISDEIKKFVFHEKPTNC